ncbi:MAG TPA: MMPL family transporter [Thermoleophilaceae bacterium]
MSKLTRGALARPRATLAVWGTTMLVLAAVGLGVEGRLDEGTFVLPGTESSKARGLADRGFGTTEVQAVMLTGPPRELDRQGPRLVADLRKRDTVLSAWDGGEESRRLRPRADAALVLVDMKVTRTDRAGKRLAPVREGIARQVRPPVRSHFTSNSLGSEAATGTALDAAAESQKIAIPILMIVLLLVFRSPIAAAIPAGAGMAAVGASSGVIALGTNFVELGALAVGVAAMMGLALGVDYSLLIVSRFREELFADAELDPRDAAETAAATAGRTVLFAGLMLALAMALALLLAPGAVLGSILAGVAVAVVLSLIAAAVAVPAALVLVGRGIDRWRIGSPGVHSPLLTRVARFALGRPLLIVTAVLLFLVALATPALGLKSTPPMFLQLPEDHKARQDFEAIRSVVSPGYATPFEIVLRSERGPMTEPRRLRQVQRLQRTLARDPGVTGVVGPGPIADQVRGLDDLPAQLTKLQRDSKRASEGVAALRAGLARAARGAATIEDGAHQAGAGARQVEAGAAAAAAGSRQLELGAEIAAAGARDLAGGLAEAARGARQLEAGAGALAGGARRLTEGIGEAQRAVARDLEPGARRLADGLAAGAEDLGALREPAATGDEQIRLAYQALVGMTLGRADPRYADALRAVGTAHGAITGEDPTTGQPVERGYSGLVAAIDEAAAELREAGAGAERIADGTADLRAGLERLRGGSARLADGARRLARGDGALAAGLEFLAGTTSDAVLGLQALADGIGQLGRGTEDLRDGAGRLTAVERLADGAARLGGGLAEGHARSRELQQGIDRAGGAGVGFSGFGGGAGAGGAAGRAASGYVVLAGVGSAPPAQRDQANMVVNAARGGDTARVYVLPRYFAASDGNEELRERLLGRVAAFRADTGLDAHVGGLASQYVEFEDEASAFIPTLIVVLSLITFVLLVVILRALVLPAVAVLLNLAIVAASFGALRLLFQGDDPLLGGPGLLEVATTAAIFTVLFALSVDYEVFLLTRMHEAYATGRGPDGAILHGIGRTGNVVTGAALIMVAVFLSFSVSEFAISRQFGTGLAIAVLLDAVLLRLFLLPAVMRLLGHRSWWLPAWLDRLLPRLDVEGAGRRPAAG